MLEIQLHFISAIVILLAALVPIYLTIRLKDNLRKLVVILSLFLLTHSVYHILGLLGLTLLAEGVFEPLSVAVLIIFGFVYSDIAKPKNMSVKNMVVAWNPATILILMNSVTTMLLLIALGIFVWLAVRGLSMGKTRTVSINYFSEALRFEILVAEGVRVASFAMAPRPDLIERLHAGGVLVIPSVGAKRHAEKVAGLGGDAVLVTLVAQRTHHDEHRPEQFHRELIGVIAELSDASGAHLVRPVRTEARGWEWVSEPV